MKPGRVLIYALILAIVGGYIYIFEIKQKEETKKKEEQKTKLLGAQSSNLKELILKKSTGEEIELKKPADIWVITSPIKTKADTFAVEGLLAALGGSKYEKVIKENATNPIEYGLDKPEFTLRASGENESSQIAFGAQNPSKSSYYAMVAGRPEVFLVADTLKNALDKSLFDLRDKTIVGVAPQDIDTIEYQGKSPPVELKRQDGDKWLMVKPDTMPVRGMIVENNLKTLTGLTAKQIIDQPDQSDNAYGLDKPTQVFTLSGPKIKQTLDIGRGIESVGAQKNFFARIKGHDEVFVVPGVSLSHLKFRPDELRDKTMVQFNPQNVVKVRAEIEGVVWNLSQNPDRTWTIDQPEKNELAESWPVSSFLWELKDVDWKSLISPIPEDLAAYGLDSPRVVIQLRLKSQPEPIIIKAGWPKTEPKVGDSTENDKEFKAPEETYVIAKPALEQNSIMVTNGAWTQKLNDSLKSLLEKYR